MQQEKKLSERISEVLNPAGLTLTGFSLEDEKKKIYMGIQRRERSGEVRPSSSIIRKIQDIAGADFMLFINGKHEVTVSPADAPKSSFLHHESAPTSVAPN